MSQESFNWIESQKASMIETLIKWANINSGSCHTAGVEQVAQVIGEYAKAHTHGKLSFDVLMPYEQVDDHGQLQQVDVGPLLRLTKRADAKRKILLCGHLDTVFTIDSHFQQCQQLDDNTLNGPGVADMKGGILAMLAGLAAFEQSAKASELGWTVLLVPDEEIGSLASAPILAQAAKEHTAGFVYEPSITPEGMLAGERKGSGNFHFVVRGKSAHAGRAFDEGINAIAAAGSFLSALHALNGQREGVTINIGQISGGDVLNKVPDQCIVRVNIRTQCIEDQNWFLSECEQIIANVQTDSKTTIEQHGGFTRPPRKLEGKTEKLFHHVKSVAASMNLTLDWQSTGGVCDGNNLCASGLPTVDTLGVRGGMIHTDQEFILLDSLTERAKLTYALLDSFAGGYHFD